MGSFDARPTPHPHAYVPNRVQDMFDLSRQDHRQFHDLCQQLLLFEPQTRFTAAKAIEHEFFQLNIIPEYTEETLLLYPDAPIPPPTMPPPVQHTVSKLAAASVSSVAGVSSGLVDVTGITQFPRSAFVDAVGPSGPTTFHQGLPPTTDSSQQVKLLDPRPEATTPLSYAPQHPKELW